MITFYTKLTVLGTVTTLVLMVVALVVDVFMISRFPVLSHGLPMVAWQAFVMWGFWKSLGLFFSRDD